jgi:processing peptidase subunit alpha
MFAAYVLNNMIGGGDSFSSGGPGKGLYSIINRYFLGSYPFFSMSVSIQLFMDTGMFTISASALHNQANYLSTGISTFVSIFILFFLTW